MNEFEKYEGQGSFYGTGRTEPPKSRSGIIAVLLILVIFLGGMVSLMSFLNIKLFQKLEGQGADSAAPVAFSDYSEPDTKEDTGAAYDDLRGETPDVELQIVQTPKSAENIPQAGGLSLQEIYASNIDSVVSITCALESGTSSGTGVILSSDGYIVTNCHVIDGAETVWVRFADGRELIAGVVGTDEISDLAVLYVQSKALKPAQFGDSSALRVGDAVVAIGDPLGAQLSGTMTDGIVSAINRDIVTGGRKMTLIQTNAALNAGNSGGPLINCYGQVIGINTMKVIGYDGDTTVEGLGFAIPSLTVKEVVDQLIQRGYVAGRPTLGITGQEVTGVYQHYYRWPDGVYVTEVTDGGAAESAGIQPGDIITHFGDTRITDRASLKSALFSHQAGDRVTIVIYRSSRYYSITLTVGAVE